MKTIQDQNLGSRIMEAAVLALSFVLFSLLTGFFGHPAFLLSMLLFMVVLYTGLRLGQLLVSRQMHLPSRMAELLSGNLLGLFAGNLLLAGIQSMLLLPPSVVVLNLIASGAAFFVLGTLSPIFKDSRSDIIAH